MKLLKKFALSACALAATTGALAADGDLLAFPGAEGFGRYAKGARAVAAPEVYHVTNLNDSGPGSLRDAVSGSGRIIVFDVSGTIILKSTLVFKGNNTILGQTAPGEGINIYGGRISFSGANNLIARYLRIRCGSVYGEKGKDAAGIANGHDMIFDHLSVQWGRDENFSVSWDGKGTLPRNITIQNSIIAQGLQTHSCGGLIQTTGGVTLYRNLYAENKTRNPKVKGLNQFVNNVVYNWGNGGAYIMSDSDEGVHWADIQSNYFVKGPWNSTNPFIRGVASFKYYGAGNFYDANHDSNLDGKEMTPQEMNGGGSTPVESLEALNQSIDKYNADKSLTPDATDYIQNITPISGIMTATEAYAWMIESVGASLPARDAIDRYLIDEIKSYGKEGTTGGISSELELPHKGDPNISGGVKPLDTDGDGMPDEWEKANGLNPNDPSDAVAIAANGYTNLENFANRITEAFPYIRRPLKLTAGEASKTTIPLSWDANENTAHGFVIELSTDGGATFAEVTTVPAGTTTHELTGLTPTTKYQVRMRAADGKGLYSDYTDVLLTETIGDPVAPVASHTPFPANNGREGVAGGITLTWVNDVNTYGGPLSYTVMLGTSSDNLEQVATGLDKPEWLAPESTFTVGNTYYWRVDATNSQGTTQSDVWSFTASAGGVLFYTDFHNTPAEYAQKYGNVSANTNIINAANKTVTVGGMTFGSGSNSIRIIAMPGCWSASSSKDYGPATAEDEGATERCVQFYTTAAGGYLTTPEVTGPCVVTLWLGNPETKSKTVKLNAIVNGSETNVASFAIGNKKRVYKHTYTHTSSEPVKFKIDANAVKIDINDVLIERYLPSDGTQSLEVTAGTLDNPDLSYADGSLSLTFNQEIKLNGDATVDGKTQWENFILTAAAKKLTISYECLNVNTDYSITFPEGVLTDLTGKQSWTGTVNLSTCDFAPAKQSGETHYGKEASLPMNFAPFNATAPFVTDGGLVQTSQKDYPHWVQASGSITADEAVMTSTSDKLMTLFNEPSSHWMLEIEYEGTGSPRLKLQESRNCDIAPGWRTIRVLTKEDFPFKSEIALDPETRMVKLAPASIGGSLKVKVFRLADDSGYYGDGIYSGIVEIDSDPADAPVEYYNLQGIRIVNPEHGLYIRRQGNKVSKVIL